ncbi:MAG: hypothetical protein ACLPKB_06775 [Xanthobacteraceae bacterium]
MRKSLLTLTAAIAALSVGAFTANASSTNASPTRITHQETAQTTQHARHNRSGHVSDSQEFSSRGRTDEFRGVHAPRK